MKKIKINDTTNKKVIICIIIGLVFIIVTLVLISKIVSFNLSKDIEVISTNEISTSIELKDEEKNEIEWFDDNEEIQNIIENNLNKVQREEILTQNAEHEYQTEYIKTDQLNKGKTKVIQKGEDGEQELIIRKIYIGNEVISDEQIGRRITKQATKEIVQVGTGKNINKSNRKKNNKINYNTKMNQKSGLTLEEFKKILSNNKNDKNKIFEENAEYFYYIEQQYNINGVFVAAIGIHESAWGTSKLAQNKKNLFGYGAYDRNAYSSAYKYNEYSASIDMIARVLTKHYLNPKGTKIFDGETATGKFYYGSTIKAVNTKYATDKNWGNAVYTWMNYLYNNL